MAKFAGFKREAMEKKILPALGYTGSMQQDEINAFLAANPAAAAKLGRYTLAARQRVEGKAIGMNEGGDVTSLQNKVDQAQARVAEKRTALSEAQQAAAGDPGNTAKQNAVQTAQVALTQAEAALSSAQANLAGANTATETTSKALDDPSSLATKADVTTVSDEDRAAGTIDADAGQMGETTDAQTTVADAAPDVDAPAVSDASTVDAVTITDEVQGVLDKLTAATGKPSEEALAEAATMDPAQLAQLGLTAAQIEAAQKVVAPDARKLEEGELIDGSTVDMDRVRTETNFEAATGAPSTDATVQGQLTGLMAQFEGNEPPAWAAGAMRAAAAQMAARGLSASSMAGQALIQAAMESALPIAVQDAQTAASFEMQNLSNRQQAAMFAAEKRAEFLGLEFSQEFQARVQNAAKISDIANMNFGAEQQIALENARLAQSVDLANLNARNAKVMADAAALTQLDMANLSNRQQAAVQQANAFLNMDMANLQNEQQTAVIRAQEAIQAMLSDQAAENAARQFNATSENQTNQFYASLTAQVAQFNNEQTNAMSRFNAGEANALAQFNATQRNARDQFNAQNHLIVAQANAQWFQAITTAENAAANQANRDQAIAANNLTMTAYNNIVQRERDLLSWAWTSAENSKELDAKIMIANIQTEGEDESGNLLSAAGGQFLGAIADRAANTIFG